MLRDHNDHECKTDKADQAPGLSAAAVHGDMIYLAVRHQVLMRYLCAHRTSAPGQFVQVNSPCQSATSLRNEAPIIGHLPVRARGRRRARNGRMATAGPMPSHGQNQGV